ncbi:hypothetical protein KEM56_005483 [Ascosphaera pollenicola]|nr:hypothetical protein KEM56_005483 [Ascosphaera pollenicola]
MPRRTKRRHTEGDTDDEDGREAEIQHRIHNAVQKAKAETREKTKWKVKADMVNLMTLVDKENDMAFKWQNELDRKGIRWAKDDHPGQRFDRIIWEKGENHINYFKEPDDPPSSPLPSSGSSPEYTGPKDSWSARDILKFQR